MKITKPILLATPLLIASMCCPKPLQETRAPCALPQGGEPPPAGKITGGCYKVCKVSESDKHKDPAAESVEGVHLDTNALLEIANVNADGTNVWIIEGPGSRAEERRKAHRINMSGDENKLVGYRSFTHKKGGTDVEVTHQVRITRLPSVDHPIPDECKLDNVLLLEFCYEMPVDGTLKWVCKDPGAEGDLGHAHAEN